MSSTTDTEDIHDDETFNAEEVQHPMNKVTLEQILGQRQQDLKDEVKGEKTVKKRVSDSKIAFGSSSERPILPAKLPPNRIGIDCYYISRYPPGPATYNVDLINSSLYQQSKRFDLNKKGWGFGNRTGQRFTTRQDSKLDPAQYQPEALSPKSVVMNLYGFGSGTSRFRIPCTNTPGPAAYDPGLQVIGRRVHMDDFQSFGRTQKKPRDKKGKACDPEKRKKRAELHIKLFE